MVLFVVPAEEVTAEAARIDVRPKPRRKVGPVLQRLEAGLRVRISPNVIIRIARL
jgi:hypothetical protein